MYYYCLDKLTETIRGSHPFRIISVWLFYNVSIVWINQSKTITWSFSIQTRESGNQVQRTSTGHNFSMTLTIFYCLTSSFSAISANSFLILLVYFYSIISDELKKGICYNYKHTDKCGDNPLIIVLFTYFVTNWGDLGGTQFDVPDSLRLIMRLLKTLIYSLLSLPIDRLITGVSMDYVHDTLKIPYSYLLELPPSKRNPFGFALPASEIESVSDEVLCSMLVTFKRIDEIIAAQQKLPTTTTTPTTTESASTTTTTTSTTTTNTSTTTKKPTPATTVATNLHEKSHKTKHSHRTISISARSVIEGNF